jgi:DNA processing protein
LRAWLRLSLTPGVGDITARELLACFGSPEQVFVQPPQVLKEAVGQARSAALRAEPEDLAELCATTQQWLAAAPDRGVLTLTDPRYPVDLLEMADPPLLLYWQGRVELLAHPQRLAVVGSRNPTAQGVLNAGQMGRALGAAGVCIVSGLALGIDGAAHEGALDGGGTTIAVVGTGLDRVYPRRHLALAHRIAQQGLLLSEFALGSPPNPSHFPKRNRIIAGLSQGTLVVEAALASGSLITAQLAADMGREVFAIPGSIHSTLAKGCHALIRQGAKLVETAQDVLEDMRLVMAPDATATPDAPGRQGAGALPANAVGSAPEGLLGAALDTVPGVPGQVLQTMGFDPLSLDALQARSGHVAADLQAWLMELELDGHVARLPGGLFQRLVRA